MYITLRYMKLDSYYPFPRYRRCREEQFWSLESILRDFVITKSSDLIRRMKSVGCRRFEKETELEKFMIFIVLLLRHFLQVCITIIEWIMIYMMNNKGRPAVDQKPVHGYGDWFVIFIDCSFGIPPWLSLDRTPGEFRKGFKFGIINDCEFAVSQLDCFHEAPEFCIVGSNLMSRQSAVSLFARWTVRSSAPKTHSSKNTSWVLWKL